MIHEDKIKAIMSYIDDSVDYKHDWKRMLIETEIHIAICDIVKEEYKRGADMARDIWNPKTEEI